MPENTVLREAGHNGPYVSLGGIVSKSEQGLVVVGGQFTMPTGVYRQVLAANGKRVWASFFNYGPDAVSIRFGSDSVADPIVRLNEGGYFQIDRDLPWTGEVYCGGAVTAAVYVWEGAVD